MTMRRRALLMALWPGWPLARAVASPGAASAPVVSPGDVLRFPRDFGAHPEFKTEWWYITGALRSGSRLFGFQATFFRSRVDAAQGNPSHFAVRQLIFAHAALTDLDGRRLLHDQRIAREGFGLARADSGDTGLSLRDWTLTRRGPVAQSEYLIQVKARDFRLDLSLRQTQPILLQGRDGYSRKGPLPGQASLYYSHPHLRVQGHIQLIQGQDLPVQGSAWMDHECGEVILSPDAVGWDWIGMNLADGGALMAFRIRRRDGSIVRSGGSHRAAGQAARAFMNGEVSFTPGRVWASPATGAVYPVEWRVDTPVGRFAVQSRLDAQELDSRMSTGGVYWEGLSDLLDERGKPVGQGYLEMTGYAGALSL